MGGPWWTDSIDVLVGLDFVGAADVDGEVWQLVETTGRLLVVWNPGPASRPPDSATA